MAYVISGIFVIAMLIVGAELLYSSGIAIGEEDRGLLDLADVLADRYGTFMSWVFLILSYGVLGSLFMPFLAITLLVLMNSRHMPERRRNGWVLNTVLALVAIVFVALGANQLVGAISGA
jgi:Mn2+/Fe2+ NRAMP family transporter